MGLMNRIIDWHHDKFGGEQPTAKAYRKMEEEIQELEESFWYGNRDDANEEAVDVIVTIVGLLTAMNESKQEVRDIIDGKISVIEGRDGKIVDGTFVKEEDL